MEVDFEYRSPRPDDAISIGVVDMRDGNRWIELGKSNACGWQQGCMLQWRPGSACEVLWNDRDGDSFVTHILDARTKRKRTSPHPLYAVSPDGQTAVSPDFRRINDMRPGYGYAELPDPHADDLAPKDSGIFLLNLETGAHELILSIADVAGFGDIPGNPQNAKHYFNHLLLNNGWFSARLSAPLALVRRFPTPKCWRFLVPER